MKLLLVAVRQMRRTFAAVRKHGPESLGDDASLDAYEALYEDLFEKLRAMAGPIPESVESALK